MMQISLEENHKYLYLSLINCLLYKDIKIMFRLLAITILLYLASSFTLEVNNIHYGYRNIYTSTEVELS